MHSIFLPAAMPHPPPTHVKHTPSQITDLEGILTCTQHGTIYAANTFMSITVLLFHALSPLILLCAPFILHFHPHLLGRLLQALQAALQFLCVIWRWSRKQFLNMLLSPSLHPASLRYTTSALQPHKSPPQPTPRSGTLKENIQGPVVESLDVMLSGSTTNETQVCVLVRELESLKATGSVAKLVLAYPATLSPTVPLLLSPPTPIPTSSTSAPAIGGTPHFVRSVPSAGTPASHCRACACSR